jgi:hypothetical protein
MKMSMQNLLEQVDLENERRFNELHDRAKSILRMADDLLKSVREFRPSESACYYDNVENRTIDESTVNATDVSQPTLKNELLEHYGNREPRPFVQVDCFDVGLDSIDCVMRPDEDGHCVMGGTPYELMHGASVRVLIGNETDQQTAVAMLRKMAESIEKGFMKDNLQYLFENSDHEMGWLNSQTYQGIRMPNDSVPF